MDWDLLIILTQDTAYYFDTTNPYQPKFKKSNRALLSSITDEIRAKPDGGFFITYMGCKSCFLTFAFHI